METELDNIFLVPVEDKFLLHAPLHGVTSLLNATLANDIQVMLESGCLKGYNIKTKGLADTLLQSKPIKFHKSGEYAPKNIRLMTTNNCNLNCLYCAPDAGYGDSTCMSQEICELALKYQADIVRRNRFDKLDVYYLGGEPFVAWDLVQYCDATGRRLADELGVAFRSECTTNAYLSESQAQWVAKHLTLVMVSLDGPAEIHNHYRVTRTGEGTHDIVVRSLRIFEKEGLPYVLRCSVDSIMVKQLPEIVEYFCREFRPARINVEPLYPVGRCQRTALKAPEPAVFISAVIQAGRIARQHGVKLVLNTANVEHLGESNCGVCDDSFIVSPDGIISCCCGANHSDSPYVADYAIGKVDVTTNNVHIDPVKVERMRSYGVSNIPRCQKCFAKFHCSGGCRLFHTSPFCSDPPNKLCIMTQHLTLWRILGCLGLFDEADRVQVGAQEVGYG